MRPGFEWCNISTPHGSHQQDWPGGWCPGVRAAPGISVATDTVGRVAPNPKRHAAQEDLERIRDAKVALDAAASAHDDASTAYRVAVVMALANGASFRATRDVTGLSMTTLQSWKRETNI